MKENKLIEHLTEAQQVSTLEACAGKLINAKNLKKIKIIETIKKDLTITTKEVITNRRVPLKDFPLFTQIDASLEIIFKYLDACKRDGKNPEVNICDLRQQTLEIAPRKLRKSKAAAEGTSQKIPKASKKKGNPSFISVIESVFYQHLKPLPLQNPQKILHHKLLIILTLNLTPHYL